MITRYAIFKLGLEAFETKDRFRRWLKRGNVAMGRKAPVELLDTNIGRSIVFDVLTKLRAYYEDKVFA